MEAIPPFPDDVSTADISFVDFKRLINGDEEECRKVFAAAQGTGFFYLSNTDIDSDFLFNLAVQAFQLPREEKMKYEYGSTGGYFGYKMSGSQVVDENGTADCSEFFNMSKDEILGIVGRQDPGYPELIIQHWRKLEEFVRSSQAVATEVLRILEENLGLEAGMLRDLHGADVSGGDLARITHAPPISSETISLGEHSGSTSLLKKLKLFCY